MKNILPLLISGAFFMSSCGPVTVIQSDSYDAPPPVAAVSYQSFYDDLSPYGNWINYPGYGYVWTPDAGPDFMPYNTNGNWIYTDAGWTWASDYAWGWAPFHYGRWFYENSYGWMWVPGNEWAPAWVSWRGGGDYYGWAPLGPDVSVDVALGSYNPPMNYWNFVPSRYMGNPQWHNYYVNQSRNVTIINNTTIINNYSGTNRARYAYAPGPDPNEVRRVSGANIRPVQIREASTPGSRISGNQYNIYRPRVDATPSSRADASARPAPARVQPLRNVRPQVQPNPNNNRPATQPPAQNPNPRPSTQPAVQNPNNNPRPSTQPAVQNPNNNRPAIQPAVQNPSPRPSTQPAVQNPNYNNNRPAAQPPVQNPNYNNNPRPSRPATQPAVQNPNPALTGRPSDSRFNQRPANNQPAQQRNIPQPSPANRAQMQPRPAAGAPVNRPQPVRQAAPQTQRSNPAATPRPVERKPADPEPRSAN
jgi:hypothetical protein